MKKVVKILLSTIFSLSLFSLVLIVSCSKTGGNLLSSDKCKAISCAYGGVCKDGGCVCRDGYEGNNCQIKSNDKFLGSWNVKEKGSVTEPAEYAFVIEPDTSASFVKLKNFYNYFRVPVMARIDHDTIVIPNQQLAGKVVFGRGMIYSDSPGVKYGRIVMRYQVIDVETQLVNDFGYYADVTGASPSMWMKQ